MANEDDEDDSNGHSSQSFVKSKEDNLKRSSGQSIRKNREQEDNQSFRLQSRSSISVRRLQDPAGARRGQRRLSRIVENITVITSCEKDPDICVLCSSGIPSSKCVSCGSQAHNKCINAFFCTLEKKVDLESWQCPKCVTLHHLRHGEKKGNESTLINAVESDKNPDEPDCPFCKVEMDSKNCRCQACLEADEENAKLRECFCEQSTQMTENIKYKDFEAVSDYKLLIEGGKDKDGVQRSRTSFCWSLTWSILLVTLAFPIATLSSQIFIIVYCFESCFDCSPVTSFFLKGIKLPGTCCQGILSCKPMC